MWRCKTLMKLKHGRSIIGATTLYFVIQQDCCFSVCSFYKCWFSKLAGSDAGVIEFVHTQGASCQASNYRSDPLSHAPLHY